MENKEREYKEERFEFALYVNEFVICKRNFKIYNFIEGSMGTLDFKDTLDDIVRAIDNDLKSKSNVYMWHYFNPNDPQAEQELVSPLIEPWECTFKLEIYDNKVPVTARIWDGRFYPKYVRDRVDISNRYVRITTRSGQTYSYQKEAFFEANKGRLSFEHNMLKGMIMDKPDLLQMITKMICDACAPDKEEVKDKKLERKDFLEFLSRYTLTDNYGDKKYAFSMDLVNKEVENGWAKALASKTKAYMREMYGKD